MAENKKKDLIELEDGSMVDPETGIVEGTDDVEEAIFDDSNAIPSGVVVKREKLQPRNKNEKAVFSMKVQGTVRGQTLDALIVPADKGGYRLIPVLFGEAEALPLYMVPYEMRDEKTGKVTSTGYTYLLRSNDPELPLELKVKPHQDSNKRVLECLIKIAQRKAAHGE